MTNNSETDPAEHSNNIGGIIHCFFVSISMIHNSSHSFYSGLKFIDFSYLCYSKMPINHLSDDFFLNFSENSFLPDFRHLPLWG